MPNLPPGIYSKTHVDNMKLIRTRGHILALLLGLAIVVLYPQVVSAPWIRFGTNVGLTIIVALGLHILLGLSGQISLGQAAFMGVGAYSAAIAQGTLGLGLFSAIAMGAVATAIFGLIFGIPAARVRGFYLALTTLAAQFVFLFIVVRLPRDVFGGGAGISVSRPILFGFTFQTRVHVYYLIIAFMLIALIATLAIQQSRVGRAFRAIRDDDLAAQVTGINVTYYKILAFTLSALFAGVAGALHAYETGLAHYEQFPLFDSVWILAILIVGGLGSVLGVVVGAITLGLVQESLQAWGPAFGELFWSPTDAVRAVAPFTSIVVGAAIIAVIIAEPRGLAHFYRRVERRARAWPFPYQT